MRYTKSVGSTPPPLSLRLGADGLRALDDLARRRQVTRAEAARQAISETAERERREPGSRPKRPRSLAILPMCARRARSRGSWKSSVVRGDIHAIAPPRRRGHVQHRSRFAVVVQADDLLTLSTIVVCPTSTSTPAASFHPEVVVTGTETRVMCELVGAVNVRALGKHAGHLTLDELRAVDDALELVLDLG